MKDSEFGFAYVGGLFYRFHKVSLKHCGSSTDSRKWLKIKRAMINRKNIKTCFKYVVMVLLKHESIGKHPKRILKIEPYIDQ